MCKNCGCGGGHHHHHHDHDDAGAHFHRDAAGNLYSHRHAQTEVVSLESAVLSANDGVADANRRYFAERGIAAFNLISSPGSGKTALLEKTLDALRQSGIPTAVIVGDQYGEADAERMRNRGAEVTQIQTHDSCHLNAAQVRDVLDEAIPAGTKLLLIENVGNLVCPVAFDLGEDAKIALLSTPEGEEKPLKYPGLFAVAALVLLTKMDLAPVLEWDRGLCLQNLRTVNPDAAVLELSARRGEGLEEWIGFLKHGIELKQTLR